MENFDAIIIGSGQGGTPLAKKLAEAGFKTALIERRWVGGTCINDGCTPTKAMIASAKMIYFLKKSSELGIIVPKFHINIETVIERQQKMVESFRNGSEKKLLATKNLQLIYGEASFFGAKKLKIQMNNGKVKEATAERIFIDTGTRPAIPKIKGLDEIPYLTSTSILNLKKLPEHLLIVGSGYVGLEFGQMYSRFGSKVTLLERSERILKKEDEDVASEVHKILSEESIEIKVNSSPISFRKSNAGIDAVILQNNREETVRCSHVLIATGRTPNTERLNLDSTGVSANESGFINVDCHLETNVKGVYALGEVNGGPAFTHISYNDYVIIYNNLVHRNSHSTNNRLIPFCMYIDPQFARVGITEQEARARELNFKIAELPMTSVARAIETSETRGFMKAVVDAETKNILGAAVLGAEGGEMMSMLQMAMIGNIKSDILRDTIFAHPTYAESINNLFAKLRNETIN
ncbi:MAG TPA: mercuric reductase [Cyclobacteriaceae bacterium]|nr:mercuric reductase [Cyclobacteriaceae bacterium]